MIPAVDPATGLLPAGRWRATLAEVKARFVDEAPFPSERETVFRALCLWSDLVWKRAPGARLWIDGGFVTHKPWAAPEDVDVAVLVPRKQAPALASAESASLWTLQNVTSDKPDHLSGQVTPRLQPMAGLVDAFFFESHLSATFDFWDHWWQLVTDEHKQLVPGMTKGYVEVLRG